ncbi:MAG TPA: flagellar basal-body MS-ring/collar protein FliF [Burkholderiales bacterium]|nr:flagellar basal-body MS-ring/collar protein FliF [Burkholderiales bacterium]
MAQAAGQRVAALTRGFTQLSISQQIGFLAAVAAIVAVIAVALMWVRTPEYRVLYSNLSERDGGEVIAALAAQNVPYRVSEGGTVVMVPADQVYDLRLKLAAQGLPKGGAVGFELMDSQKFGVSQFAEQVNYQRALAGELARTIQSIASVQSARVHLAIPRPSVFVREQQQSSASVFVSMYPGRMLDSGQVSAIQHMVSSSVPELPARNVSVVDQAGNLLSAAGGQSSPGDLDASQLKYLHAVEMSYASRIENILKPLVGADNVHAQVTAALDFSRVEQTSETFKPNPAPNDSAVRSQQTVESTSSNGAPNATGVPGALSNQPPGAASAPLVAPGLPSANGPANAGSPSSSHRENVTNFELDKTIRHTRGEVGAIKRLSAAVVVNYRRETAKDGTTSYKPLPEDELKQINALAREALGFSQERGDSLNVVNAPFSDDVLPGGVAAPSPWSTFVGDLTTPAGVGNIAKYVVAGAAVLIALMFLRSTLRDITQAGRTQPVPHGLPGAEPGEQLAMQAATPMLGSAGASLEADLKAVKDLAKQEPRLVANVVKDWVGRGE